MFNLKYEVLTSKSFNEAVESVENEIQKSGFGVLWKINFKEKLAEKGFGISKNFMSFEVCNPKKAKEILDTHIDIGYLLPCKMVVYESDEGVKIGLMNARELINDLGYKDILDKAVEVEEILINVVNNAK